jgi:hypothetical protein
LLGVVCAGEGRVLQWGGSKWLVRYLGGGEDTVAATTCAEQDNGITVAVAAAGV